MEQNDSFLSDLMTIWDSFKNYYLSKMSSEQVKTWFGSLLLVDFESDTSTLTMQTDSTFKYKILISRYLEDIQDYFSEALGFPIKVNIICDDLNTPPLPSQTADRIKKPQEPVSAPETQAVAPPTYKFRYTFENFILS